MSKAKGIKDFGAFDVNPFVVEGIERKVRYKRADQREVFDRGSGESMLLAELDRSFTIRVDSLPYVKVYCQSLEQTRDLSVPAGRLYWYVLTMLRPGRDHVTLDINEFLDTSGYAPSVDRDGRYTQRSRVPYYKAATELLDKQYLSKRAGGEHSFFINVNKFFNGDRTKL